MEDIQLINESGNTFTIISSKSYSTGVYKNREIWYCAVQIKIGTQSYGGQFEGWWEFTFMRDTVSIYIEQLTKMHSDLSGSIRIEDTESDANVSLEMVKHGHVAVYGNIGGTHTKNYLTFKYETDQTVLPGFINFMKSLL